MVEQVVASAINRATKKAATLATVQAATVAALHRAAMATHAVAASASAVPQEAPIVVQTVVPSAATLATTALPTVAFYAQRDALERAQQSLKKLAAQAHGEHLTALITAWEQRSAEAVPSAALLGKSVSPAARTAWSQAVSKPAAGDAATALLRMEMAADVPTPAEHISARRMLQLQLLTKRNEAAPVDTWALDTTAVLSTAYDPANAKRLQTVLKALLR
jgi:hypothetical protein